MDKYKQMHEEMEAELKELEEQESALCKKLDENESRQKQILELVQPFRQKFGDKAEPQPRYNG